MESINYKLNLERAEKQFIIDRKGKVIKFNGDLNSNIVSFHSEIAAQIIKNIQFPLDFLVQKGFIIVGSLFIKLPNTEKEITNLQYQKLKQLGFKRYLVNGKLNYIV